MADYSYQDPSAMLPSRSAYVNPGEYEATQRSVALQKGSYMAEMDQFYAQLKEAAREFDLSHALEEQRVGLEEQSLDISRRDVAVREQAQALTGKEFEFSSALQSAQFLENVRQFDIEAALRSEELRITGSQVESMSEYYGQRTDLGEQIEVLNWIGAAGEIFGEGGIWEDLTGIFE